MPTNAAVLSSVPYDVATWSHQYQEQEQTTDSMDHITPSLDLTRTFLSMAVGRGAITARDALEMTREQAAEVLGVGVRYLYAIEEGLALPSFSLFVRMVDEYDVSADSLLGWRVNPAYEPPCRRVIRHSDALPVVIGLAIRQARESLSMTRLWLAARLGVEMSHLSKLERGAVLPSLLLFARTIEELDLCADALLLQEG